MRKWLKILLFTLGSFVIMIVGVLTYANILTFNEKIDEKKFVNPSRAVIYYTDDGEVLSERSKGVEVVEISDIKKHTQNAFIAIEDKRFYSHNGVDKKRLVGAVVNNIKSLSFKEGASTITQQLIKNTHLSGEKTIKRKLAEIKLAKKLEKKFTKKEILEKYLNTIYFGDNCYGIASASKHYFDKNVQELTINESAILAGVIKSPQKYSPTKNVDNCIDRKNTVLKAMFNQGFISESEYKNNCALGVKTKTLSTKKLYDSTYFIDKEISNTIEKSPYFGDLVEVYTGVNIRCENILKNAVDNIDINAYKSAILMDKNGKIIAYSSNIGDVNRQMGSILKPLSVYAPAIEENVVDSFTMVSDERCNFNGYSPSNYNNRYYGKLSVKDALANSSNTVAVKILNSLTVNKSVNYLQKMNFNISNNDRALTLALGATEQGGKLSNVVASYSTFLSGGYYTSPHSVINMRLGGKVVDKNVNKRIVFSSDSAYIVADMLKETVKSGTAKKLSTLPFPVYAKTGTVGDKNGNSDAYTVSFTDKYILGVWIGAKDEEKLSNNITGGSLPTTISKNIWEEIYKSIPYPDEIEMPNTVQKINIDKISFDNDGKVVLADKIAPKRFVKEVLVKKSAMPNAVSTRFSSPKIEKPILSVKNNEIIIRLCQIEYINTRIYKACDNKIELIFDSANNNALEIIDNNLIEDKIYEYYVIPYYRDLENIEHFGERIYIGTIKTPRYNLGEYWIDEI